MSVIAEFRIPGSDFALGRILPLEEISSIELETLVPIGAATVRLLWIHDSSRKSFLGPVREHHAVNAATEIETFEDQTLFTLDWDATEDRLLQEIRTHQGQLLSAIGTDGAWNFELRFPSQQALTEFTRSCQEAQLAVEMLLVYNPKHPDEGAWYGLTTAQRSALILAVERGYFDIPRDCTTTDLAAELGISDQAVVERLRRGIVALATHSAAASRTER